MQVKDLKAGDDIEVIELVAKSVGQGKFGKPPKNTPYQHLWLTDGTADIRFSLFGEDVNKIREGQTVKVIDAYVKEYPAGSGKLQLSLSRDHGTWQIVDGQALPGAPPIRREDITPAPVQIVSSDARDKRIVRQTCLKVAGTLWQGLGIGESGAVDMNRFLLTAQAMYDWVMEDEPLSQKPPEQESAEKPINSPLEGPQATRAELIAAAKEKEDAGWTGPPETALVQKFAAVMNGLLGDTPARHLWTKWAYGGKTGSSKEVTGAKLQVVLDMLGPTYTADKRWLPTKPDATEAIKAMYQEALKEAGRVGFGKSVEELYGPQEDIPF